MIAPELTSHQKTPKSPRRHLALLRCCLSLCCGPLCCSFHFAAVRFCCCTLQTSHFKILDFPRQAYGARSTAAPSPCCLGGPHGPSGPPRGLSGAPRGPRRALRGLLGASRGPPGAPISLRHPRKGSNRRTLSHTRRGPYCARSCCF